MEMFGNEHEQNYLTAPLWRPRSFSTDGRPVGSGERRGWDWECRLRQSYDKLSRFTAPTNKTLLINYLPAFVTFVPVLEQTKCLNFPGPSDPTSH